jgi:hypothetical protein
MELAKPQYAGYGYDLSESTPLTRLVHHFDTFSDDLHSHNNVLDVTVCTASYAIFMDDEMKPFL